MDRLLLLLSLVTYFFLNGMMEGYWKKHNTAKHWYSIGFVGVFVIILLLCTLSDLRFYNLLAIPFLRKVPFDYGYMIQSDSPNLLGTTSWDDILIRKLSTKNFPGDVLALLVITMVGVSLLVI